MKMQHIGSFEDSNSSALMMIIKVTGDGNSQLHVMTKYRSTDWDITPLEKFLNSLSYDEKYDDNEVNMVIAITRILDHYSMYGSSLYVK